MSASYMSRWGLSSNSSTYVKKLIVAASCWPAPLVLGGDWGIIGYYQGETVSQGSKAESDRIEHHYLPLTSKHKSTL